MTNDDILKLRPGDPIQAAEAKEIEGADGWPAGVERIVTPGYWPKQAIEYLRERNGLPPLPDDDEDDDDA